MSCAQLLATAKRRALELAQAGYTSPDRAEIRVAGPSGRRAIVNGIEAERAAGRATANDVRFAEALAIILTGGLSADPLRAMTESELMRLEWEAVHELVTYPATRERIEHMLATGKPLRN